MRVNPSIRAYTWDWDYEHFIVPDAAAMGRATRVTGSGLVGITANELYCSTGATLGSYAEAVWGPATTFARQILWHAFMSINQITDHIFEFGLGWPWLSTPDVDRSTFEIEDGVIRAVTANGVATGKTDLVTMTDAEQGKSFAIKHNPGVSDEFYVDGVLLATRTTTLPRIAASLDAMIMMAYNKAAEVKELYINPGMVIRIKKAKG